ncbi:hypothetical protein [Granulicella sp. dw_53]|uniref:hypothetical protein n=1 Tax=Granulicella sp. dw_53 TaxID=2719792 RepID=UPI001BD6DD6D|nr:hypothetical protein [Granulicella sp. dw_53]
MAKTYKLVAVPSLSTEGVFKGRLETVTFVAASEKESHKWWSVNVGTFEKDFTKVVSPELAKHLVNQLRAGEIVEFPNRYELTEVKGKFGGRFED